MNTMESPLTARTATNNIIGTMYGFVHLGTIPKGFQMKDGSYQNICIYYHQL